MTKVLIGSQFKMSWADVNQPTLRLVVRKGEDDEQTIVLVFDEVSIVHLRGSTKDYVEHMQHELEKLK